MHKAYYSMLKTYYSERVTKLIQIGSVDSLAIKLMNKTDLLSKSQ